MNTIKHGNTVKQLLVALVLTTLLGGQSNAAGVPVFDATAIAHAVTQVNNQVKEIEQLRAQVAAVTGNHNYAGLLSNPTIKKQLDKYLPQGYSDIFAAASRKDMAAIEKMAQAAQQSNDPVARAKAIEFLTDVQVDKAFDGLVAHAQVLQRLKNQLNGTQDMAAKQDLANSILAESAMINNEIGMLQLQMKQAERAEAQARRQMNVDAYRKSVAAQQRYNKAKYYPNSLLK